MTPIAVASAVRVYALRFPPGQDLRLGLFALARREGLRAGAIVTCVGSLTGVTLRYAGRDAATVRSGPFEIVSLVGTLDPAGGHLHLCVADSNGTTFGGHLLDGCVVRTTAEVIVAELTDAEFRRVADPATGYRELTVAMRRPFEGAAE